MAWSKNGTTTLSSAGDDIDITSLTASDFNVFLSHVLNSSAINVDVTTDNNSNTDYAVRRSDNGGADATDVSDTNMNIVGDGQQDAFIISYGANIDGEEKLFISNAVRRGTAGAGNAPNRRESVSKVDTTTNSGQYTRIDINNSNTGDFDTGSNLTVLNGDTTEEVILGSKIQSGSRFEATDTRKIYYGALPSVTFEDDFSSNSGWTHSSQTSVSGGVLNWDNKENTVNVWYYTTKSLGTTLSDTKWVMTFDLRIDNLTLSGSIPDSSSYGLYLSSSSANADNHDVLAFAHYFGASTVLNKFRIYYSDSNVNTYIPSTRNTDFTTTPTASTTYYITLVRESATSLKGYIYSDSARTTLLDSQTLTIPNTITSLAYVRFVIFDGNGTNSGFTPTDGHIDNIKVYDGVTSTDFTWTEEA